MKKVAIALALCMGLSTLVGGVALAAAQRAPLYPVGGGTSDDVTTEEPSQGRVVINNPKGDVTLIIQGNVTGLTAGQSYDVWVRDLTRYTGPSTKSNSALGYYLLDTFTANRQGKGHFHLNILAADLPAGSYTLQVAINPDATTLLATEFNIAVSVGS